MNWEKNRLVIAGVAFVAILAVAFFVLKKRDADPADDAGDSEEAAELPAIDRDAITALRISRPAEDGEGEREVVRLVKSGETWTLAEPLEADADTTAVNTALDKLEDLEVTGVAATREANHERLEVDDAHAIEVTVEQDGAEPVTLLIGAFGDLGTMVRLPGEERVLTVGGSIKYAFNKDLKDWRNRRVLDIAPDRVVGVTFESAQGGTWTFTRNAQDEWTPIEGQTEIERFGGNKVQSVVASVSRMRAVGFAADDVDVAAAGLQEPTGTVTLVVKPEDAAEGDAAEGEETAPAVVDTESVVLSVGAQREGAEELYLQLQGEPTIYVISKYLADRMRPDATAFQTPEPGSEPEGPAGMPGMPPGMGGPGGPGGQQIPPELMQQIQQQLQQQQAGGGHP